ncbi:MAG: DUF4261 domain-containing protein [Planctomycetes bacterium]|nr:DUF4261 domain-containing protein [Planctomycetota bacterium]
MHGYAGAIVLLGDKMLPSVRRVRTDLMQTSEDETRPTNVALREGALVVEYPDGIGIASLVPEPLPWSDLLPICEQSWHWPEAAKSLEKHQGQVVVSVGTTTDDAIHREMLLTRLVSAVTSQSSARGVFWVDAGVVHSPTYFVGRCIEMSRELLPLELWVGFNGLEDPDGLVSMCTMGLRKLGYPEIEVRHSSASQEDVFDIVFAAAHFVVDNRAVLKEGDVFEVSDEQQLPVHQVSSSMDASETAILLEM